MNLYQCRKIKVIAAIVGKDPVKISDTKTPNDQNLINKCFYWVFRETTLCSESAPNKNDLVILCTREEIELRTQNEGSIIPTDQIITNNPTNPKRSAK